MLLLMSRRFAEQKPHYSQMKPSYCALHGERRDGIPIPDVRLDKKDSLIIGISSDEEVGSEPASKQEKKAG